LSTNYLQKRFVHRERNFLNGGAYGKNNVKTFHSVVLALAIGAASITSANAHDSFNLGINIGGYGFAPPPVVYYPHPAIIMNRSLLSPRNCLL
jgi:hypothetical protein